MSNNAINYNEVPQGYAHCIITTCPLAGTCLRALAWQTMPADITSAHVLNPARTKQDSHCPYYRSCEPVTYAIGFTRMQSQMYPKQYDAFSERLIALSDVTLIL